MAILYLLSAVTDRVDPPTQGAKCWQLGVANGFEIAIIRSRHHLESESKDADALDCFRWSPFSLDISCLKWTLVRSLLVECCYRICS